VEGRRAREALARLARGASRLPPDAACMAGAFTGAAAAASPRSNGSSNT